MDAETTGQKDSPSGDIANPKEVISEEKDTQPSQETTGKTYTQEDFDNAVKGRHSTLDKQISKQSKEIERLSSQLEKFSQQQSEEEKRRIDADEKAELESVGDDSDRRKHVSDKYQLARQNKDLATENSQLKNQNSKVTDLMTKLDVSNVEELIDLLDRANKVGIDNEVKRLSEVYKVSAKLISPLASRVDSPKELEELVQEMSDELLAVSPKLPNPDNLQGASAMGDDVFMKMYAEGKTEDHKRAKAIQDKRTKGG